MRLKLGVKLNLNWDLTVHSRHSTLSSHCLLCPCSCFGRDGWKVCGHQTLQKKFYGPLTYPRDCRVSHHQEPDYAQYSSPDVWPLASLSAGVGPDSNDETLLLAIASALHMSSSPITGQTSVAAEKNPTIWLNTAQPLCKAFTITDEHIRWLTQSSHSVVALIVLFVSVTIFSTNFSRKWCVFCYCNQLFTIKI